jgi:hypothetical protein
VQGLTLLLLSLGLTAAVGCGGGGSSPPVVQDTDHDGVPDAQDCAPNDPTKWQMLSYQSVDADSDGKFANSSGQVCAGASLPPQYSANAVAAGTSVDCDDTDATRWQLLPYAAVDADGDGFSIAKTGQVCSGASLPKGYSASPPDARTTDCDDSNPTAWRWVMVFADKDGDGVGAGPGVVRCVGSKAPAGYSFLGYDPLDDPANPSSAGTSTLDLPSWLLTTPQ